MAFLAAARRAASQRILTAAATTASSRLLTAEISAAATPLLLTSTAEISAAATSLLLSGAATTTAATPLLLSGAATTTAATPLLPCGAATAILGRRAVFCPAFLSHAPATLHRRCFSTSLLGDRNPVSAPAYLATAGSRLARRGIATEALTPAVQRELERMEKEAAARHDDFMKELQEFEVKIMSTYSAARLSSAETALTAGKVAWRVSTAVLAFGVTTLVTVLQVIREGWKTDFQEEVKRMLEEMIDKLKTELLAQLRQVVRRELELIEAEKAAAKK